MISQGRRSFELHFVVDAAVVALASWTLASHLTVLTRGSLHQLLVSFLAIAAVIITAIWKYRASIWADSKRSEEVTKPDRSRLQKLLFVAVTVLAVALTLVAHRPDEDDSQYLSWAAAAVDDASAPILDRTTMHGFPDESISPPHYRFQSIEMLVAAAAWLLGVEPIFVSHLALPPIAALLTMFAYGSLFRLLVPRSWAWASLATFVFLCANGAPHRAFGNFSFVRLHQGKGVLVSFLLPMILYYGLRFARRSTRTRWTLLAAAQVAAVGTNVLAFVIAPIVSFLALLSGLPEGRWQTKSIVAGMASSVYPALLLAFASTRLPLGLASRPSEESQDVLMAGLSDQLFIRLREAWESLWQAKILVLGEGSFAMACLACLGGTWLLLRPGLARRLSVVFPIGFLLCFLSPVGPLFWSGEAFWYDRVVWRAFWILPLPTLAGLALVTPLERPTKGDRRWPRYVVFLGLLAGLWLWAQPHIFSETNRTRLARPGLKAPESYHAAWAVRHLVDDRPNVLGPVAVTSWITTMPKHPYPLLARFQYSHLMVSHAAQRREIKEYIEGMRQPEDAGRKLHEALSEFSIEAVCLHPANRWKEEIIEVLRQNDFRPRKSVAGYEIWWRLEAADPKPVARR